MQACSACICEYNLYKCLITLSRADSHTGGQPSLQVSVASSSCRTNGTTGNTTIVCRTLSCKPALHYCAAWQKVRPSVEVCCESAAYCFYGEARGGEQTLSECGQGKQEACKREGAFPAHEARVVQGVAMLPAHTHHPPHQHPLLNLHVFFHLCAPFFFG